MTYLGLLSADANNTDNSEEIIRKHLGHLPGETVVVEFDGMGPTWTILVERGLAAFPDATHGIIADADFTPTITCHRPTPETALSVPQQRNCARGQPSETWCHTIITILQLEVAGSEIMFRSSSWYVGNHF